ncbi:hypothetical protein BK120_21640 [Paenibacillus sp. FSL A5-0031]|uniref:helix-turn-helix domain-containing protein n=1 Tax=Paenibacillus sp. FSL A5-0031 TaxID=1920420 RepID=UPI00096C52FE|nr:helix-turn-helix transcriptional regulator [Paenibacillus sp. FSL A5-0031]OME79583.1 hypothetical protein BK120_21640 [Paenibacillus sp. FSL A5-0031]
MELKIKNLRVGKDLTQLEVAVLANITQPYLSEIETGKTKPSLDVLERLSRALNVSISDLF